MDRQRRFGWAVVIEQSEGILFGLVLTGQAVLEIVRRLKGRGGHLEKRLGLLAR
jgi:hypothetical protein